MASAPPMHDAPIHNVSLLVRYTLGEVRISDQGNAQRRRRCRRVPRQRFEVIDAKIRCGPG